MKVSELTWAEETRCEGQDTLYTAHLPNGDRLTVLHRMTGYGYSVFDTETGYRDLSGKFWLASGNQDVRKYKDFTVEQAIEWVKTNANNCVGE